MPSSIRPQPVDHCMTYASSTPSHFFFNDTATTEIYTLSLHDALPICPAVQHPGIAVRAPVATTARSWFTQRYRSPPNRDRKSTRLNSSHGYISYAVFCLKKKKSRDWHRITHRKMHTARHESSYRRDCH